MFGSSSKIQILMLIPGRDKHYPEVYSHLYLFRVILGQKRLLDLNYYENIPKWMRANGRGANNAFCKIRSLNRNGYYPINFQFYGIKYY